MYGNKGLWADGWKIVTSYHIKAWDLYENREPDDFPWELYNLAKDPDEIDNLAARDPAKVADLDRLFRDQAVRFHVDPIAGNSAAREYSRTVRSREFQRRGGKWVYPAPVARISETAAPPILFRSYILTADVSLSTGSETGPIFAIGAAQGGFAFYLKEGKPAFALRAFSGEETKVTSSVQLRKGANKLTLSFMRHSTAQMVPSDIDIAIGADGKRLVSQTVRFSMPALFSADNTFDIGRDDGSAVTEDYQAATAFPGELSNIVFDFNQPQ
jgi:arylsulfatase